MAQNDTQTSKPAFPQNWQIAADFDPNAHLMQLKGRDYMNVQNRLLWFIRDQRVFISAGLATTSYAIQTELVEIDREKGWAHFRTMVRDVLGNEATMYGSESAHDFGDYAEKASTKSLGRALLALGYGTAFAPEMDEGERVVDAPVERRAVAPARVTRPTAVRPQPQPAASVSEQPQPVAAKQPATMNNVASDAASNEPEASEQQMVSIRKLCAALNKPEPETALTYNQARQIITQLSGEYQRARRAS
ncbi:MAG: hypothetical protein ABI068_13010 [Ktedonobacterales bacterium]